MRISITNHVILRYRQRATHDSRRHERSSREIKEIVVDGLVRTRAYGAVEELVEQGTSPSARVTATLQDGDTELGRYCFALTKGEGRNLVAVTMLKN
ncbi:hypothetical protein FJZ19_00810 [Candidatus Pacearchaeota archaeon]|nr:hypothetical protein [Candidatus Pacearchaeota archaeon]